MTTLETALAAGYPAMAAAVIILWKAYKKAKEDHLKSVEENERTLVEIRNLLADRKTK